MAVAGLRSTARSRCFFEDDGKVSLVRRSLAEGIGTMMLMIAVVGSGVTQSGSPLVSAMAIAGSLIALILAFGALSGGHFNPTITFVQWLSGERGLKCTIAYIFAQLVGGVIGSLVTSLMFAMPIVRPGDNIPGWLP